MSDYPSLSYPPRQVREALQQRIGDLLPRLGIRESAANGMVTPLNPRRNDRHPGSFVIWTSGDAIGAWRDYALDDTAKGDVFDLIQYLERLATWRDAYNWALDFLGWGERQQIHRKAESQADRERLEADRLARERRAQSEADGRAKKALGLFLKCQKDFAGTPVWAYLTQARGLPLERLPRLPGAIRFHPGLDHLDPSTGEVTTWPAMVCAMSRASDGQVRGLHRTYLTADGLGKAPVDKAKKMMGLAQGCAIRVWKGEGDLTPEDAARQGKTAPLIITEGIEDAITAAIARPEYRVWAAGSLSLMGTLDWHPCASAVVLVADNDWDKPAAVEAFEKVAARWRGMAEGRPLNIVRAQKGKDLNDWARGQG